MLSIISVGISKYTKAGVNDIPCAGKDAKRVYSAFEAIMGEQFSSSSSICLENIDQTILCSLIQKICYVSYSDLNQEDTLVMYFSGHAEVSRKDPSKTILLFSDYNGSQGALSIDYLVTALKDTGRNVLLILDCCFSGDAIRFASNASDTARCAILTSCSSDDYSVFDDTKGSLFSDILCKAIYEIICTNVEFSLNTLTDKIVELGYTDAQVNSGASSAQDFHLILKPQSTFSRQYHDFSSKFIEQLKKSDIFLREAMWYSLADAPESVIYEILDCYFGITESTTPPDREASWIVRRSIGSLISCMANTQKQTSLLIALISSAYWQDQCIGIIGAKYVLKENKEIYNLISTNIQERIIERIDVIWIANLYMSECPYYPVDIFLKSPLSHSAWGVIEIYKSLLRNTNNSETSFNMIQATLSKELLEALQNYIKFTEGQKPLDNKLYEHMRRQKKRGRLPEKVHPKLLLSMLYGSWRDQINLDLKAYLGTTSHSTIKQELKRCATLMSIEMKMALLMFFQTDLASFQKYSSELKWSLSDCHPWVRREAVKLYKIAGIILDINKWVNCISETDISENAYPGLLDLFLELPEDACDSAMRKWEAELLPADSASIRLAKLQETSGCS